MKFGLVEKTRPLRWGLIKILSPNMWRKVKGIPKGRGSTLYAMYHFKDKRIKYCEIGINKGKNVLNVMKSLNVDHSYLVDMYEAYDIVYDEQITHVPQDVQDNAFKDAKKRLKPYENKITWILKYSDQATEDLPNDIDFIYIDGNHEYDYVKKDIELYWSKISKNGILAGHDFRGRYHGIIRAVSEFSVEKGLPIYSNLYDWWFLKKELFCARVRTTNCLTWDKLKI